jgi:peptidoglycan hydrolase CwlO-like protein
LRKQLECRRCQLPAKDILEAVNFIKDHMVTKTEFNEAVDKLDNRLTAVESKIAGIHNRIDDEPLKRANLENRVRSVAPNLPPPPERV